MQKTRFPTPQLVIVILLALLLAPLIFLMSQPPQALAAPASQTVPTAEPCQPAVLEPTSSVINARTGPGPTYPVIGELVEGQAYTIAGRHHGFTWWAVTLSDGATGWVWDNIVSVSGNVDAVPLLDAPPLNGIVPDTEEEWTPISDSPPCEATPEAVTEAQPAQETPALISVSSRLQNEWETPVDLSMSGAAADPTIVIDESGSAHAIWQEEVIESFVYSQGPTDWTAPIPVELPFGTRIYSPELQSDDATPLFTPTLVADGGGRIHALWIDDDGNLYHSSVSSAEFANFGSWSQRVLVAESVITLDTNVDASQTLHVTFARSEDTEDQPSGLYYLQSRDAGVSWSAPTRLHQTRYFRTLSASKLSVSITVSGIGDQANVFVAWDNRILDRVFLVRSLDGGATWTETATIDSREFDDPPDAAGPAHIMAQTHGDQLHLLWRAGHEAQSCGLYHQWSGDDGETWQSRQLLPIETPTCPLRSQFLVAQGGLLYVLTSVEQEGHIVAWNGERWSDVQREPTLNQFFDPDTSRQVVFHWQDATIAPGDRLLVIGPDDAENSDVWLIARSLGNTEDWFPPPSPWSPPLVIVNAATRPQSPLILSDQEDTVHAFWTQSTSVSGQDSAIYYSTWDRERWTRPAPILASPGGVTQRPSVTLGPNRQLFAVWQSGDNVLYFSQALSRDASFAQEWSDPEPLIVTQMAASSPQIVAGPNGILYIAYAVTLNEQRGIYLITSDDQGSTWSEPVLVFDGVGAGWDMIDDPRLAVAGDGILHLLWTRRTLPPSAMPLSLHYARSLDGGQTWSDTVTVDEGSVDWTALVVSGDSYIHKVWRIANGDRAGYWNSASFDAGQTWSREELIPIQLSEIGTLALAIDQTGQTHVVTLNIDELQHLWWDKEEWNVGERLTLTNDADESLLGESLVAAATIDTQGHFVVLYAGEVDHSEDDEPEEYIVFNTVQELQLSEDPPVSIPTSAPSPTVEPSPTSTPSPAPSPTVSFPEETGESGSSQFPWLGNNIITSIVVSIAPVLLLIVIALFVGLRRSRRRR